MLEKRRIPRDHTAGAAGGAVRTDNRRAGQNAAVGGADTDGPQTCRLEPARDTLVDEAGEHHVDDFHLILAGHAHAVGELGGDAESRRIRGNLGAASVHEHDAVASQEGRDVGNEVLEHARVRQRPSPDLHDNRRAVHRLNRLELSPELEA